MFYPGLWASRARLRSPSFSKMSFKLIRIDEHSPCSILLKPGLQSFGRNSLFDCTDMRVSRSQGQFEVGDEVTLKALHHNPCFYIKESGEKKILLQNCSVTLNVGDKFGLLPDSYWYRLTHSDRSEENFQPDENNVLNSNDGSDSNEGKHVQCPPTNGGSNEATFTTENLLTETPIEGLSPKLPLNCNDIDNDDANNSPSLLDGGNNEIKQNGTDEMLTLDHNDSKTTPKRHNSTENGLNVKKIKTEPNVEEETNKYSVKEKTIQVKAEKLDDLLQPKMETGDPDAPKAGTSSNDNLNQNMASSLDNDRKDMPQSPLKPTNPLPLRERCMYGAGCYRKNPQHKVQFSHPSDNDWGVGARGQCPWGSRCRRRNPRHWTSHDHPPGTMPPSAGGPAPPRGMRLVERHGNIFYIQAHTVNFYDDHFQAVDSDDDSVDYDYEF